MMSSPDVVQNSDKHQEERRQYLERIKKLNFLFCVFHSQKVKNKMKKCKLKKNTSQKISF